MQIEKQEQIRIDELVQTNLKLRQFFESNQFQSYLQKTVPPDYYSRSLEERRDLLDAPSTAYLCKSILMENTAYDEEYAGPYYPRYICILIQYVTKINAEKVMRWARNLQSRAVKKAPKSKFHYRLIPEDLSFRLSGYQYNSVTPFCMTETLPVLLSNGIKELKGKFFWMGGGHVDIKLRMSLEEFLVKYPQSVYFGDIVYDNDSSPDLQT